jgi:uncharacterized protein (DUF2336 family)
MADSFVAATAPARPEEPADLAGRVRAGANPATAPELLLVLAADPAVTVRAAVAMNAATPADADRLLRDDDDARVRALLASRLAKLIPSLPTIQRHQLREQALANLAVLVEDEAERVRAAIADAVKDMPEAPRELVLRLARDSAPSVCGPVIRLSPLLSAEDLLLLLSTADSVATVSTVASRPGLPEAVSDAIAATADTAAIRSLLTNQTAAIREATLDALIGRAEGIVSWHAPLVRRPLLSATAAHALSAFVATELLNEMANRGDLDPAATDALRHRLAARLEAGNKAAPAGPDSEQALVEARRLQAENKLDETSILAAVHCGETRMATALLAVAAEVAVSVVERAAALRSAKGMISLVWRSGFSMRVAGPLQTLLCRLPPGDLLRANTTGGFPMAVDEMRWQIDFLSRMGR